MATNAHGTNEGIAHNHDLGSHDTPRLGVDSEGAVHYHDTDGDQVVVVDADGELVAEIALEGRSVSDYRQFIAEEKGGWAIVGTEQLGHAVARAATRDGRAGRF